MLMTECEIVCVPPDLGYLTPLNFVVFHRIFFFNFVMFFNICKVRLNGVLLVYFFIFWDHMSLIFFQLNNSQNKQAQRFLMILL